MALSDLRPGQTLGPSSWIDVDQPRINGFADVTDDHQWIHVDVARAAEGPFGSTIAHGWLILALMAPFTSELLPIGTAMAVNYGVDRVRFISPVPAGSRIRATFAVDAVTPIEGGTRLKVAATVEREGGEKPACAAELLFHLYD
jgi:acyl dehydratase